MPTKHSALRSRVPPELPLPSAADPLQTLGRAFRRRKLAFDFIEGGLSESAVPQSSTPIRPPDATRPKPEIRYVRELKIPSPQTKNCTSTKAERWSRRASPDLALHERLGEHLLDVLAIHDLDEKGTAAFERALCASRVSMSYHDGIDAETRTEPRTPQVERKPGKADGSNQHNCAGHLPGRRLDAVHRRGEN